MKFDQDIVNILHTVNDLKERGAKNLKIIVNIYTAGIMAEYATGDNDKTISYKEVEPDIYYMGKLMGIDVYVNKANNDLKDYVEIDCTLFDMPSVKKVDLYVTSKLKN